MIRIKLYFGQRETFLCFAVNSSVKSSEIAEISDGATINIRVENLIIINPEINPELFGEGNFLLSYFHHRSRNFKDTELWQSFLAALCALHFTKDAFRIAFLSCIPLRPI